MCFSLHTYGMLMTRMTTVSPACLRHSCPIPCKRHYSAAATLFSSFNRSPIRGWRPLLELLWGDGDGGPVLRVRRHHQLQQLQRPMHEQGRAFVRVGRGDVERRRSNCQSLRVKLDLRSSAIIMDQETLFLNAKGGPYCAFTAMTFMVPHILEKQAATIADRSRRDMAVPAR